MSVPGVHPLRLTADLVTTAMVQQAYHQSAGLATIVPMRQTHPYSVNILTTVLREVT